MIALDNWRVGSKPMLGPCLRANPWEKVNVPPAENTNLQATNKVRHLVAQEEVSGSLVQQPPVTIGLPKLVVEMKVLTAGPDAPLGDPQEAGVPGLQ
jgi:hypothetical protein